MLFKLLKSKRGVGMEYAIIMMLTVFGFCSVLTTAALMQNAYNRTSNESFVQSVALDQIGEDYVAAVKEGTVESFPTERDPFMIVAKPTELSVFVKQEDGSETLVLHIVVDNSTKEIIAWEKRNTQ